MKKQLLKEYYEFVEMLHECDHYETIEDSILHSTYVFLSRYERFKLGIRILFTLIKK